MEINKYCFAFNKTEKQPIKHFNQMAKNSNIIHEGDFSYTEDKILIYKIYVSNIPTKVNEEQLSKYFQKFGSVSQVDLIKSVNQTKHFTFGFVNFIKPESASKALRHRLHILENRQLKVRSADSWKQPHPNHLLTNTNDDENSSNDSTTSILNLNDDCLFLILEYLEFHEQIRLSTLCFRFQNLFKQMYKIRKSLKIDLEHPLTLMDFREGLQQVGQHIEKITFSSGSPMFDFTRFIDFVSKLCPNLQNLHLNSLHFKYVDIFHKISYKLKNIKQLELKNCSINDEMIKLLATMPKIEDLDLTQNFEITGQYLHEFKNLKRLILNSCANIQSSNFIQMCQKIVNLKELNIRRCDRLNLPAFESMAANLDELEILTISTCYQTSEFYVITKLKSLKYLTVNGSNFKTEMLFTRLATDKADQIEILRVTNYNHTPQKGKSIVELKKLKQIDLPFATLTSDFLLQLTKLTELKILTIPGCNLLHKDDILNFIKASNSIEFIDVSKCKQINNRFIFETIEILKEKNCIEPLTLRIGSNGIKPSIKEDPSFMNGCELIKLDFNTTDYVMEMYDDSPTYSMSDSTEDLYSDDDDEYNFFYDNYSADDDDYMAYDCMGFEINGDDY